MIAPNKHGGKHTTLVLLYCPYFEGAKVMHTIARTPTTDMEVTSIRLERELKDKLKEIAGNQGYQALIRDILWNYVQQKSGEWKPRFSPADIRASITATAQQEERCVLTGQVIQPQQPMLLGLTRNGDMVPLSVASLAS
jgi:predicted DNA-binding ribbon-helix-helix protein